MDSQLSLEEELFSVGLLAGALSEEPVDDFDSLELEPDSAFAAFE
jgi:hypothetical protein